MAEKITLARPYAKAIFQIAKKNNIVSQSLEWLEAINHLMDNETFERLLKNPSLSKKQRLSLFSDILVEMPDIYIRFLQVLLDYRRVFLLRSILSVFKDLMYEDKGVIPVFVQTAFPLLAKEKKQIMGELEKALSQSVELFVESDRSLIGGVICRTSRYTFDWSIKGLLKKVTNHFKERGE